MVCGEKDLWKRNVLRRQWKSAGVMVGEIGDEETGELTWSKRIDESGGESFYFFLSALLLLIGRQDGLQSVKILLHSSRICRCSSLIRHWTDVTAFRWYWHYESLKQYAGNTTRISTANTVTRWVSQLCRGSWDHWQSRTWLCVLIVTEDWACYTKLLLSLLSFVVLDVTVSHESVWECQSFTSCLVDDICCRW